MVWTISSSVSPVQSITMSVRWTITSSATVSLKSKTFSIISFSSASMEPFSSLRSIRARSSSSDTDWSPASGLMRVMRRNALQSRFSARPKGPMAAEVRFGGIISQYLKFFTIKFKTSFYYAILGTVENAGVPGARRICGGAGCRGRPRSI